MLTLATQRNLFRDGKPKNSSFGFEKVVQVEKTESISLSELKMLAEECKLIFDEYMMTFMMENCITIQDTNENRKRLKKRYEEKIDSVTATLNVYVAFKHNKDMFE